MNERAPSAERWMVPLLVALVVIAYAPVLGAGFLSYDDPWLIEHNRLVRSSLDVFLPAALFDFSRQTRLALGAEYLPLRDLLSWLQLRSFGVDAESMHVVSLMLYISSLLLLRSALRRVLGAGLLVEVTIVLFALHPLHTESVAWLSGQKDVLASTFIAAALYTHARSPRYSGIVVPLLVLGACFTKATSVVTIGLLASQDWLLGRRLNRKLYAATAAITAVAVGIHVHVGSTVGMMSAPLGGSRYATLITMGPVWTRYVVNGFLPTRLSVTYFVPDAPRWSFPAALGYLLLFGSLIASAWLSYRRGQRVYQFAWFWFFIPLIPVSQLVTPLQNRMADRYAYLSVLAPCLLTAHVLVTLQTHHGVRRKAAGAAALLMICGLVAVTFSRSVLFTDAVLLFSDAAQKDPLNPKPVYHLGRVLAETGRETEAIAAFREAWYRDVASKSSDRRRAANGLSTLLAKRGSLDEAEAVLRTARAVFPDDSRLGLNLARVLRATARQREAEALERRFAPPAGNPTALHPPESWAAQSQE